MQPETQKSIDDIRARFRSRKANAESAFQTLKFGEMLSGLSTIELAEADGWQLPGRTPAIKVRPRIR
jgi:hypothetical protein